jgi:hypothetical protein
VATDGKDVIEEEEEAEEEMIDGGSTAEFSALDTICNQAIITICRINIFDPPAPICFGEWNQRPLSEKEAKKLVKEMVNTRFSPFAYANAMPLIMPGNYIDKSCIRIMPDIEGAPMLELTEEAKEKGQKLVFAGGRHRQRATQILVENSAAMIKSLEKKIADLKKSAGEGMEERVKILQRMLNDENNLKEKLGLWGVIVYEEG